MGLELGWLRITFTFAQITLAQITLETPISRHESRVIWVIWGPKITQITRVTRDLARASACPNHR